MTQQEQQFEEMCKRFGISFISGIDAGKPRLDYYLPFYGFYVELKTWSSPRLHEQLQTAGAETVLVLVGPNSVSHLEAFLIGLRAPEGAKGNND